MSAITRATRGGTIVFVHAADINNTPAEWNYIQRAWLHANKAVVLEKGKPTSDAGVGKREIDYIVMSSCLCGAVKVEHAWESPCSTHAGLRISIDRKFLTEKVLQQRKPRPLPTVASEDFAQESWASHKEKAEKHVDAIGGRGILEGKTPPRAGQRQRKGRETCDAALPASIAAEHGTGAVSADLGCRLWCWTRAAEMATIEAAGPIIKKEEGNIDAYLGRAAPPVFRETPLQKSMERGSANIPPPVNMGRTAAGLATVTIAARRLQKAVKKNKEDTAKLWTDEIENIL